MQTDFALKVGQAHSLERGIKGSKATHQRVSRFYAQLNTPVQEPYFTEKDVEPRELEREGFAEKIRLVTRLESPTAVAERLTKTTRARYAPLQEKAAAVDLATKKAKESEQTAKHLLKQAKPMLDAVVGLSQANQEKLASFIKHAGDRLLKEQREQQQQKRLERQQGRSSERKGYAR